MNPIKNKEWENELWVRLRYLDLPKKYDKGLVDFISSLLKTQKQEIIRIAEGIRYKPQENVGHNTADTREQISDYDYADIYNQSLSDLIEKLKEMEEGR